MDKHQVNTSEEWQVETETETEAEAVVVEPPLYAIPLLEGQAVHETTLLVRPLFGPEPERLVCWHCGADVVTSLRSTASLKSYVWALGCCCCGCWPCAFVPFLACPAHVHSCPSCHKELGVSEV